MKGLDDSIALVVASVSHQFAGNMVLRDISFAIKTGTVAALLGPSGCGKTTLLRLIAGLETIQQGKITLFGIDVADAKRGLNMVPESRRVGLVFQDFALFPHLNVRQNILFGVSPDNTARIAWVDEMMRRFGLDHRAKAYPPTLSGGEQQRVALLRALAPAPELVLLDEPFSSLDATRRLDMREDTLALIRESGASAVMVTHDANEAMFMADDILVLNEGRIIQQGPPESIYNEPAAAFIMGLFGHVNRFEGVVDANGMVATAVGLVAAGKGSAPGQRVEVYIRANAFALSATAKKAPQARRGRYEEMPACRVKGEIIARYFMGASYHLHVRPADNHDHVLHVQLPVGSTPKVGEMIELEVDAKGTFVFPVDQE